MTLICGHVTLIAGHVTLICGHVACILHPVRETTGSTRVQKVLACTRYTGGGRRAPLASKLKSRDRYIRVLNQDAGMTSERYEGRWLVCPRINLQVPLSSES